MREVLERVEQRRDALNGEALFRYLSNESIDPHARLSFAPSMLYYLMGFKDVLAALAVDDPQTKYDRQINAYCVEDSDHWRWYLSDLEKLGYGLRSWGSTIPEFCDNVWSTETEVNRRTIFALIHYAKLTEDPLVKLVLIQIFEATGVVFIGHTRKAAIAMCADDELYYFGRVHYEEEFGHTVQAHHLADQEMSIQSRALALRAVDELFDLFEEMFDCWYEHRERYPHTATAAL